MTVRVGVVGAGLVAQAEHLPYLSAMRDRFSLAALAEPSLTVREALGARYGIAGLHADYRAMLDAGGLDAVVVCSPHGTHAEVVLASLEADLHVFVEKPMCITLADADAIVAARGRTGNVVQVGTMKRFDPAVEAMLDAFSGPAADLCYVSVVVNDPEFEPYFEPGEIVRGADVPAELIDATRRQEAAQVAQAVGSDDPNVVRALSESFLGSLLHDLNVVHGALAATATTIDRRVLLQPRRGELERVQLLGEHELDRLAVLERVEQLDPGEVRARAVLQAHRAVDRTTLVPPVARDDRRR